MSAVGVVIAQYQLAFTFGLTRQFFRFFPSQEIAEASIGILARLLVWECLMIFDCIFFSLLHHVNPTETVSSAHPAY